MLNCLQLQYLCAACRVQLGAHVGAIQGTYLLPLPMRLSTYARCHAPTYRHACPAAPTHAPVLPR